MSATKVGSRHWVIPDGYIPAESQTKDPKLISHEAACLLNTSDEEANVNLTLYFANREPSGPYALKVPPRRTLHVRFNDLKDPEPIPRETDYSVTIESDAPIVVQHTRLDSRMPSHSLMSTIAYPASEPLSLPK